MATVSRAVSSALSKAGDVTSGESKALYSAGEVMGSKIEKIGAELSSVAETVQKKRAAQQKVADGISAQSMLNNFIVEEGRVSRAVENEFSANPHDASDALSERLQTSLLKMAENKTLTDQAKQLFVTAAESHIGSSHKRLNSWISTQVTKNTIAWVGGMSRAGMRVAMEEGDIMKGLEIVQNSLSVASSVLGPKETAEQIKKQSAMVAQSWVEGTLYTDPASLIKGVDSGFLDKYMDVDKIQYFRGVAERRLQKMEATLEFNKLLKHAEANPQVGELWKQGKTREALLNLTNTVDTLEGEIASLASRALETFPEELPAKATAEQKKAFEAQKREYMSRERLLKSKQAQLQTAQAFQEGLLLQNQESVREDQVTKGKLIARLSMFTKEDLADDARVEDIVYFQRDVAEAMKKGDITMATANSFLERTAYALQVTSKEESYNRKFFSREESFVYGLEKLGDDVDSRRLLAESDNWSAKSGLYSRYLNLFMDLQEQQGDVPVSKQACMALANRVLLEEAQLSNPSLSNIPEEGELRRDQATGIIKRVFPDGRKEDVL